MSDRTDRKDYREDLGTALSAVLVGTGKPATSFYDHLAHENEFNGQSPVVCLASSGTAPTNATLQGKTYTHRLMVLVFVTREDTNADDTLDQCYTVIADYIEGHRKTTDWADLDFDGPSQVNEWEWGGGIYWVEAVPITVRGY